MFTIFTDVSMLMIKSITPAAFDLPVTVEGNWKYDNSLYELLLNHLCAGQSHLNCMILSIVDEIAINVIEATIVLRIWALSLHSSIVDGH